MGAEKLPKGAVPETVRVRVKVLVSPPLIV
jgi:hypothetical protein